MQNSCIFATTKNRFTLLQVLVSIQALIFVSDPWYTESSDTQSPIDTWSLTAERMRITRQRCQVQLQRSLNVLVTLLVFGITAGVQKQSVGWHVCLSVLASIELHMPSLLLKQELIGHLYPNAAVYMLMAVTYIVVYKVQWDTPVPYVQSARGMSRALHAHHCYDGVVSVRRLLPICTFMYDQCSYVTGSMSQAWRLLCTPLLVRLQALPITEVDSIYWYWWREMSCSCDAKYTPSGQASSASYNSTDRAVPSCLYCSLHTRCDASNI